MDNLIRPYKVHGISRDELEKIAQDANGALEIEAELSIEGKPEFQIRADRAGIVALMDSNSMKLGVCAGRRM